MLHCFFRIHFNGFHRGNDFFHIRFSEIILNEQRVFAEFTKFLRYFIWFNLTSSFDCVSQTAPPPNRTRNITILTSVSLKKQIDRQHISATRNLRKHNTRTQLKTWRSPPNQFHTHTLISAWKEKNAALNLSTQTSLPICAV